MTDTLQSTKIKLNNKEYLRVDDSEPIWFVWTSKGEYETVYNYKHLEKEYMELNKL